ncbi:MAG TPA: sigma-70 factor domain-containing protein, partial [Demequina sp.]|nr:sigma-70 factor domain-containing protein [Demequina sp.]
MLERTLVPSDRSGDAKATRAGSSRATGESGRNSAPTPLKEKTTSATAPIEDITPTVAPRATKAASSARSKVNKAKAAAAAAPSPDEPEAVPEEAEIKPDAKLVPEGPEEIVGFVISGEEDDAPVQQVMTAGATADPVKDYLKQIGKVALLNAEQEVDLAKRIEAGLFAEETLGDG